LAIKGFMRAVMTGRSGGARDLFGDLVERGTERTAGMAVRVTTQCLAQHLKRTTVLQRQAARDRSIGRHDAGGAAGLVAANEDFRDLAFSKAADGRGEGQPLNLEAEGLA
jgi:hypothetical protein